MIADGTQRLGKVLFLIRSLERGGAERQLVLLASCMRRKGWDTRVAVFYPGGYFENELRAAGIPVISLDKSGRWDVLGFTFRLAALIRRESPDILHGYLDVPNVLSVVLRMLCPRMKVACRMAASKLDWRLCGPLTRPTNRLALWLMRFADLIICNSTAGRDYAVASGAPPRKLLVIANGVDADAFQPDLAGRERLRREWGIGDAEVLIGVIARLDPIKDHETFLAAAATLVKRDTSLKFICVGEGPGEYRAVLESRAAALGLKSRIIWAGARSDMREVYNAIDLMCSSSVSEGLPNTVLEAMACGKRCVVTDVGDCAWVVGKTGYVVPPGQPEAMAQAILRALADQRNEAVPRDRVLAQFSVERLVEATERALVSVLR